MKYAFIWRHRKQFKIARLCGALGVSRSGFYDWLSRPESRHAAEDRELLRQNHTGSCMDEPAKALKAGDHGVPGGENMIADRRGNVRYFTIREMARLQGFPDDFVVEGSWKAATRQLGNAVPTCVGQQMGKLVLGVLAQRRLR